MSAEKYPRIFSRQMKAIVYIFMSIGSRRKEREISGICFFLVTHLNHELTRAAYEFRVWVRARALS